MLCVFDIDAVLSLDVFSDEAVLTKTLLAALLTYWRHKPTKPTMPIALFEGEAAGAQGRES